MKSGCSSPNAKNLEKATGLLYVQPTTDDRLALGKVVTIEIDLDFHCPLLTLLCDYRELYRFTNVLGAAVVPQIMSSVFQLQLCILINCMSCACVEIVL